MPCAPGRAAVRDSADKRELSKLMGAAITTNLKIVYAIEDGWIQLSRVLAIYHSSFGLQLSCFPEATGGAITILPSDVAPARGRPLASFLAMAWNLDDTIVAIATPPGRGGIGVVRLAGPEALVIASSMLRLKHELVANRSVFGEVIEPATGERIDEAVVTFFARPHSYTADDVVEISAHGSPIVLRHIVELATSRGARLAEPGEFTMRAFLNGRIDLTQAEAVRDLIESQTLYQAKVAAQQLEGALPKRLI